MAWTFTSDSCGYMLYKDGVSQGGARTMGTRSHTSDGRRRHWRHVKADSQMHAEQARSQCERNNFLEAQKNLQPAAALADQA